MSRDVSVRQVQNALSDLTAWKNGDCPDWGRNIVQAAIQIIESILCNRDEDRLDRESGEGEGRND